MEVAELMIKVKLYELDKHRNETTFRPLLFANKIFREVGIEFVKDGNADFAFVGQASFVNKRSSLEDSVSMGMEFLKTKFNLDIRGIINVGSYISSEYKQNILTRVKNIESVVMMMSKRILFIRLINLIYKCVKCEILAR